MTYRLPFPYLCMTELRPGQEANFYTADQHKAAYAAGLAERVPEGWKLVPIEPTRPRISAMMTSQARDGEGQFPPLMDILDYSGENKSHTVLEAAYRAMLAAAPEPKP